MFFLPAMLSVVMVGFIWQLILSPLWGVASGALTALRLGILFRPWLGCSKHGADHAVADVGLAERRHPHDVDLRRAARYPTRSSTPPGSTAPETGGYSGAPSCP